MQARKTMTSRQKLFHCNRNNKKQYPPLSVITHSSQTKTCCVDCVKFWTRIRPACLPACLPVMFVQRGFNL